MATTGHVKWTGGLQDGSGSIDTGSGALDGLTYSAASRFADGDGTNPEELLGASHASCFSMALTLFLETAGYSPESIETTATVTLKQETGAYTIHRIALETIGTVPDITQEQFEEQANNAKEQCPISKALASVPTITLDAKLAS